MMSRWCGRLATMVSPVSSSSTPSLSFRKLAALESLASAMSWAFSALIVPSASGWNGGRAVPWASAFQSKAPTLPVYK